MDRYYVITLDTDRWGNPKSATINETDREGLLVEEHREEFGPFDSTVDLAVWLVRRLKGPTPSARV